MTGWMPCPGDDTLLALVRGELARDAIAGVDAHLDGCGDCRDVVVALACTTREPAASGEPPHPALEPAPAPELELLPARGASVGRFVVLEVVGGGAMGVVLSAYDPELDRRVAIKLLRPELDADTERGRARLLREAQAMARLSHPNVVTVYDVGAWRDAVFVAMELVDGVTLGAWLAAAPRTWRELREVFLQAGRGLAAAHAAGLVHRDFKPDNVVVGRDGRARVADFGLAGGAPRGDGASAAPDEHGVGTARTTGTLTRAGGLVGTPAYMAPEQLEGQAADARSDQFAFCVALFEALHGRRPFEASSLEELRRVVATGRVAVTPRAGTPRAVTALLRRGLALRPEDRFASMDALLAQLGREGRAPIAWAVLAATLVAGGVGLFSLRAVDAARACGAGADAVWTVWSPEVRTRVRRSLVSAAPGSGETIARTVVARATRWANRWADAQRGYCRQTLHEGAASSQALDARSACLRRQLTELDALAQVLVRADERVVLGAVDAVGALPDVSACADLDALASVTPLPIEPARRERITRLRRELAVAGARVAAGHVVAAEERVAPLVLAARETRYGPIVAEASLVAASAARAAGHADAAEAAARQALFAAEAARDDGSAARAWIALVAISGERGRFEEAARLVEHARAALLRAGSPADLVASLHNLAGVAAEALGRLDEARSELRRALELRRRLAGSDDPEVARVLTNLGNVARAAGEHDEALRLHRQALEIDRRSLGETHPALARSLHNLGGVLRLVGRPDEALSHYRRALELRTEALGPDHPEVAITRNSIGLVYLDLGRPAEARAHFDAALAVLVAAHHAEEAVARHNLALLDAAAGDHASAVAHLTRALALEERQRGERHEKIAVLSVELASSLIALGRRREAELVAGRAEGIAAQLGLAELARRARSLATSSLADGTSSRAPVPLAPPRAPTRGRPGRLPEVAAARAPVSAPSATVPAPARRPAAAAAPALRPPVRPAPAAPPGGSTYVPGRAW